jgi:hypothetical protein
MKIYYLHLSTVDGPEIEAFGSKREAEKRRSEIIRDIKQLEKEVKEYYDSDNVEQHGAPTRTWEDRPEDINVTEIDFPISKAGIIRAINWAGSG